MSQVYRTVRRRFILSVIPASSLSSATRTAIDAYWALSFACPVEALRPTRALVVPHAAHESFRGVYAMTFGAEPIVSVPVETIGELAPVLRVWTAATLRSPERALASLGQPAREVIGPAWLGYADAGTFRPRRSSSSRMLDPGDAISVGVLRDACTSLEWEHGGSALGRDPVAGSFVDGVQAALAGYETWGDRIAHIAVVSHPAFRGRGHARAAVAAIARYALDRGLVLQYRTLESNTPSRRIADSLGFHHVATSLAVRLHHAVSF
jgi:GNAT superfamily N-acetyltransferase